MIVSRPEDLAPDHLKIPNGLEEARLAAGIATTEELAIRAGLETSLYEAMEAGLVLPRVEEFDRILAVLGDVPEDHLYIRSYRQLIGLEDRGHRQTNYPGFFEWIVEAQKLLVSKDEVTWLDRRTIPDRPVEVFLSMSCGTLQTPHLLLDTVAVCQALGVDFVAAAGPAGCCGKPYIAQGNVESGEVWIRAKAQRARKMGATIQVNWCTACQQTATTSAARRKLVEGVDHPVRESQTLTFLADRLEAMGDRVPWATEVRRRVVAEGHDWSPIHTKAWQANARLLAQIPGVEVVGTYDGFSAESPCGWRARDPGQGSWTAPETAEDVIRRRGELADVMGSLGADTIACQHQGCHKVWSPYSSDRLTVQHAVSILAEALGCTHPDRYQAAVKIGDAGEIVRQTRPNWESWGLTETEATEMAGEFLVDDRYAAGVTQHFCAGGGCSEKLISLDVLRATARPVASGGAEPEHR